MLNWTEKQKEAIFLDNRNIIVSASAGSGKTAVLTERVLRKINEGTSIDELLVLTFTEKAATEMKMRIRKKLEEQDLKKEIAKIESASISTFDAFSLNLVKQYSYLLNVPRNIKITDSNIVKLYEKRLLEEIFDKEYIDKKESFLRLIEIFVIKDDKALRDLIINIYNSLELIYDKEKYLKEYIDNFYSEEFLEKVLDKYNKLLLEQLKYLDILMNELSSMDSDFYEKLNNIISKLLNSKDYLSIKENCNIKLPNSPNGSSDELKNVRSKIKEILDNIVSMTEYEENTLKQVLTNDKPLIEEIITLLQELNIKVTNLKQEREIYTFSDVYKLSIKLVIDYPEVREYLKAKYKEIMIDEYQDTNDLQELFISQIAHDNLYMVGDVKQSIYKFRDANPDIFNNKYNDYNESDTDTVIDLNKNFRSRKEVLDDINIIFSELLAKEISFIDYKKEHMMEFGFNNYNELKDNNTNYNLDIYTYKQDKNVEKEEQEIFIIANDIKEKIASKMQIYDKETNSMRDIKYSDIAILIDRATSFDTYKKIFEYLEIPLNIEKEYKLALENDIYIIKNLIKLIIKVKEKNFDEEFKYAYLSIGRSYLYRYSDEDLFLDITSNKYKEKELYKKCLTLSNLIDILPASEFFLEVLNTFNYYEKLNTITNIKLMNDRIESIYDLIKSIEENNNTIYEIVDMLEDLIEDNNIRIAISKNNQNSVNLMTIHKSKGLEFPICYLGGLYKDFNLKEIKQKIIYNKDLGIIINSKDSIYKKILNNNYKASEIDEKTRLLYVALTRACEKIIIVMPEIKNIKKLNIFVKNKFNSFMEMLESIYDNINQYIIEKDVIVDNNYKYIKNVEIKIENDQKLIVKDLNIPKELVNKRKYSKDTKIITALEKEKMHFGTKIHEILEYIDFNDINLDKFVIDDTMKEKINMFINSDLIKNNKDSKYYQEYEFIYEEAHGIIDLLIENKDEVIIVDYKLKNIDDDAYNKQLLGYKEAISKITDKKILVYLYSIYDGIFKEIREDL